MTAIDTLLDGFIDYAGLYAPASLDMQAAVRNYLRYRNGKHGAALGRLIIDLARLNEFRDVAGAGLRDIRLSVIGSASSNWNQLPPLLRDGFAIESIEIKPCAPSQIENVKKQIPADLTTYFEVPVDSNAPEQIAAISDAGARAKIRMGGLVAESFPQAPAVVAIMNSLANSGTPFKATAGLHHPLRSLHPYTYETDSPAGTMHGFVNLCCAAAAVYFGGDPAEAVALLEEEDADAWRVLPDCLHWRSLRWSTEQLSEVRKKFLISFGSCSFAEPIQDLEAMAWL